MLIFPFGDPYIEFYNFTCFLDYYTEKSLKAQMNRRESFSISERIS